MLQTRSFNLNIQHTVFTVPYTETAHAQLYLSCVLPAPRAVKECIEKELKYHTIQADTEKYKFSQWFPDESYVENYFTCCFEHQKSLPRQALE